MLDCLKDIQHQHIFDLLSASETDILNTNKTSVHYKKGELIIKQGTIANTVAYTKSGIFKLHIEGIQKNIILTFKGPKVFLGLSSLYYTDNIYLYSVTAMEDCEVEQYDMNSVRNVMQMNIVFTNEMVKILNHNMARFFKRFVNMTEKNARGKVANMLMCLASSVYFSFEFTLSMSRQEMAEFLGISMENIVRILKEFENDKLLIVEGKNVKILEPKTLDRICDFG